MIKAHAIAWALERLGLKYRHERFLKERTAVFHHKMGGTGIRNIKLSLNLFTTYYQAAKTGR